MVRGEQLFWERKGRERNFFTLMKFKRGIAVSEAKLVVVWVENSQNYTNESDAYSPEGK